LALNSYRQNAEEENRTEKKGREAEASAERDQGSEGTD